MLQGSEEKRNDPLLERLADVQHEIWTHWMRWQLACGTFNEDGTWTMPQAKVERWQRQMRTPYAELSEAEKDSDRDQARKVLAVLWMKRPGWHMGDPCIFCGVPHDDVAIGECPGTLVAKEGA